jgi:hypothetical protein
MAEFWTDIGNTLKGVIPVIQTVAPTVASALGGPLAGMAVQALSTALLGKPDGTAAELNAAMLTATPEQMLALRKQEDDFKTRMAELDVDVQRINAGDRNSAREREAKTGDSATPRLLAFAVTAGFFSILCYVLAYGVPRQGGDAILLLLGSLATAWGGIITYYFGSSAGSAAKTDQIATMMKDRQR